MGTIRRRNPRKQGEIGLGAAIAWFTANGWCVSIPLADNQPYDLVVDREAELLRVQVKTTTYRNSRGRFEVDLRTNGGNRSRYTFAPFDPNVVDLVFVLTDDDVRLLIPAREIQSRTRITIGDKWSRYVVGEGFEPSKA